MSINKLAEANNKKGRIVLILKVELEDMSEYFIFILGI